MAISVKRARGYVDFCTDLSLRAQWEEATEELDAARRGPGADRLVSDVTVKAARVRDIEEAMEATVVRFWIEALSGKRWRELGMEHPPRDDNEQDQAYGVNVSTFFDAVAVEPGCMFSAVEKVSGAVVDFDPKTDWMGLADDMTDGQYGEFVQKFLTLNRGGNARPFSRAASSLTQNFEPTSNSQSGSGSPTSD